jgi:hypothetical protein
MWMTKDLRDITPDVKTITLGTTVQPGNVDVNQCIYCGATEELTDEHTIPYALWGKWVLGKGSCRRCAVLTSRIEQKVGSVVLGKLRESMKAPTRHSRKRKRWNGTVQLTSDAGKVIDAPIWATPQFGLFPQFDYLPRGIFRDTKSEKHDKLSIAFVKTSDRQHPSLSGLWSKAVRFNSNDWCRLLVKIAYGEYIRTIDAKYRSEEISNYILHGIGDDSYFVGGKHDDSKIDHLNDLTFCTIWEGGRCPILAYVRLLSYMVYLGNLNGLENVPDKLNKRRLARNNIWPRILAAKS